MTFLYKMHNFFLGIELISFKTIIKVLLATVAGWSVDKAYLRGGGVQGVQTPPPPPEIFRFFLEK